jgi:hypothetical protein
MNDKTITIELSLDAINFILESLADRPFRQSAPLIDEIRKQAAPQVEAPEAETVVQ